MKEESCFGIIPVKRIGNEWKLFLVLHKNGNYFGFPKGHKEGLEQDQIAAERELREETSLEVKRYLAKKPFFEEYISQREKDKIHKRVWYYLAEAAGKEKIASPEIISGSWHTLKEGKEKLTYQGLKEILDEVADILNAILRQ